MSMKAIIPSRLQGRKSENEQEDLSRSSSLSSFQEPDISSREFTSGDLSDDNFITCSICKQSKKPSDYPKISIKKIPECRFCCLLKKRGILCMKRDVVSPREAASSPSSSKANNTSLRNLLTRKSSSSSSNGGSSTFVTPVNGQFI